MQKLSVPATSKGKFDEGIPIYVTGGWKQGLTGGYDEIFGKFREAGFGAYRWDKPEHNAHGDSDQFASIQDAFENILAFVMLSENPTAGGGSSQLMLGAALMDGIPTIFVDPNAGRHFKLGRSCRDHQMIANLVGHTSQANGRMKIVKSIDAAIAALPQLIKEVLEQAEDEIAAEQWKNEEVKMAKKAAAEKAAAEKATTASE